jgi:hypothetical protein
MLRRMSSRMMQQGWKGKQSTAQLLGTLVLLWLQ